MDEAIVYQVITRLVGPIKPVGESHTDDKRHKNLKLLLCIMDMLIHDLMAVVEQTRGRHEHSIVTAGSLAEMGLNNIHMSISGESGESRKATEELKMLRALYEHVSRLRATAPVDDDFPEMMHNVDTTLYKIDKLYD